MFKVLYIVGMVFIFLCSCSRESAPSKTHSHASTEARQIGPEFHEAAARAIACIDGMRSVVLSSDIVYESQRATCAERVSYLQQSQETDKERQIAKDALALEGQCELCRSLHRIASNEFGSCLTEFGKRREQIVGENTL